MKLTREEALKLHQEMWGDMKAELGDNPTEESRLKFKEDWCFKYFPDEEICSNCFLCEYVDACEREYAHEYERYSHAYVREREYAHVHGCVAIQSYLLP